MYTQIEYQNLGYEIMPGARHGDSGLGLLHTSLRHRQT